MAAVARTESVIESIASEDSLSVHLDSLDQRENYELQAILAEATASNEALEKENRMFEKFQKRLDPKDVQLKSVPMSRSSQLDVQKKKVRLKGASSSERLLRLTMDQKCNIANREVDELREEIRREEEEAERNHDNLRAVVAEAEMRLAEVRKSRYEFDRDILRGAINPRTGRIMGEKVLKYFQDRLKSRDGLAEKLRLKNATLRVKRRKLQGQLKQKEEAGEVRHEVDFRQLKIENQQLTERYQERNQEVVRLKISAANTLQILNTYKKKLHSLSLESQQMDSEIAQRKELQGRVEAETRVVTKEKKKAEEINTESRRKLEDYRVPDVMEYVQETASLAELTKAVKAWERKVVIGEMALRTYHQTWKRMCAQSRVPQHQSHLQLHTTAPMGATYHHHTTPLY